jgi:EAL domain-containing protein (putative c-di-GMP-specific phosphodiesterase class I)
MRMDVVAEGVETFEQVIHLRELGIRSAQGYVFAPPLPGSLFLQLIDAIDPLPVAAGSTAARPAGRANAA